MYTSTTFVMVAPSMPHTSARPLHIFGIFTMTNLGQLFFNTTNIDVSVVRTTANSFTNGQPAYQFPSARTQDTPAAVTGTGDFYQNTLTNYRDPQSAQWKSYVGMSSYRMSQTVDLNQVEPSDITTGALWPPPP